MFVGVFKFLCLFVYPGWSVRDTCYFMENQQNVPSSYYKVASEGYNRRMLSQVETFKDFYNLITTDFKYLLKSNQIAMLNSVTSKLKTFRSSTFLAQCRKNLR